MNKDKLKAKFRKVKQILGEKTGHIKQSEKTTILGGDYSKINVNYQAFKCAIKTTVKHLIFLLSVDCYREEKKISHRKQLAFTIENELREMENPYLSAILASTSSCLKDIDTQTLELDSGIEDEAVIPLKQFLELFDALDKCKRELEDERINIDECKMRLISVKKTAATSGSVGPQTFEKIKNVETEFMDSSERFDNKQEMMAIELLNFLAKCPFIADVYIKLMILESCKHKNNMNSLQCFINEVNEILSTFSFEPVFGMSLTELSNKYGQEISVVIECFLKFLIRHDCFQTTGLFRIGSEGQRIKQLKNDLNNGTFDLSFYNEDLHTICGALKLYLYELPEPLFPVEFGDEMVEIAAMNKLDRILAINKLLKDIPSINTANLLYLVSFFSVMAEHEETTRMSPNSIAIVVAPNLLHTFDISKAMAYTQAATVIFTDLIVNFELLYPELASTNEFKT